MANVPPPAKGMSAQEYYSFLIQQGVPGWAAYDAVTANFGTPDQARDDYEKDKQPGAAYQWGQVAGLVGGAMLTREALSGFENVRGLFKVKNPDGTEQAVNIPTAQTDEAGKVIPASTVDNPMLAEQPTIIGLNKDGSAMMSDGSSVAPDGTVTTSDGTRITDGGTTIEANTESTGNWSDYLQYAGYALAAYNTYKALTDKNATKKEKTIAATQAGLGAAQTYNASAGGSYGPWLAAAQGAVGSYDAVTNKKLTDEQKTRAVAHNVGMTVANYYTFGLAGLADAFARSQWGGTMGKVDKFLWENKYGKYLSGTAPLTAMSKLWTSDAWKTEGDRLRKLQEQGVEIPEGFSLPMMLQRGRRKEELVRSDLPEDYIGFTPEGEWVNNKFAKSRDVRDLRGTDIVGYSAFFEKFGNDWMKYTPEQREKIAQIVLDNNAVQERKGTIDISWTPELETKIGSVAPLGSVPTQPTTPPQQPNKMGQYKPGQSLETMSQAMGQQMSANPQMTSQQQQPVQLQGWNYYEDLNNRLRNQGR